ncbi:META domain-containing protein [Myroides sp. 1354]|uniref:META domain-containing protein n=1 Tax=unclassified Myroides TaxID=2642485 RepID=UPI00257572D0|nr:MULTISPECIES: META domain-containing protein [unclassified Myroides]MDM1045612.1 META domain-containing protein [Myroides sp. R163-1]MDM1056614.1 META domain-containing protein [Myroides sp. 1354]MDM1069742.1 META domain-containing protein [Myroides sp. 1372]
MNKIYIMFLFLLVFVTPAAAQIPQDSVLNTTWILTQTTHTPPIQRQTTLQINTVKYEIKGFAGCNNYTLPIKQIRERKHYTQVETDAIVTNDNRCTKNVNEFEQAFFKALSNQKLRVNTADAALTIVNEDKQTFTFSMQPQNPLLNYIEKHAWKLIQLQGNSNRVYHPYLTFDFHNNTVAGYTGCSYFTGKIAISNNLNKIQFFDLEVKKRTCMSTNRKTVEKDFIQLLEGETFSFDVAEQTLNLYQDNQLLLMFGFIPKQMISE